MSGNLVCIALAVLISSGTCHCAPSGVLRTQLSQVVPGNTVPSGVTPLAVKPPAAVTLIASVNANEPFASMAGHYVQMLGGQRSLTSVSETSGVVGSGTVTGPMGASTLRFGKINDPLNPSRKVFYMAAKASDGMTYFHLGRVEIGLDATTAALQKTGTTYWLASELYLPASRFSTGSGTLVQVHHSQSWNPATGPFLFGFQAGDIFNPPGKPGAMVAIQTDGPSGPTGQPTTSFPWGSDVAGYYGQTFGAYPRDAWVKVVCKYRGDPMGTGGLLQIWLTASGVTTQIVNLTNIKIGISTPAGMLDYAKSGLDDLSGGGTNGVWELRRSLYLFQDNGNTEQQIRTLMQ